LNDPRADTWGSFFNIQPGAALNNRCNWRQLVIYTSHWGVCEKKIKKNLTGKLRLYFLHRECNRCGQECKNKGGSL